MGQPGRRPASVPPWFRGFVAFVLKVLGVSVEKKFSVAGWDQIFSSFVISIVHLTAFM